MTWGFDTLNPRIVAFIGARLAGSPAAGRDTTQGWAVPPSPLACQPAARASSRCAGWLGRADRDGRGKTRLRLAPVAVGLASTRRGRALTRACARPPPTRATTTQAIAIPASTAIPGPISA